MENKVTMIIPLYNKALYIESTLNSVLNNYEYENFECIVVDDESTDGSSEIAWNFCKEHSDIFKYIKIQHQGGNNPSNARNVGIKLADSEYICFLDADDELLPGFITRAIHYYNSFEIDLYIENNTITVFNDDNVYYRISNKEEIKFITSYDFIAESFSIPHFCACMYKTKIVKDTTFLDMMSEDLTFLFCYSYKSGNILLNYSENAFHYHNERSELAPIHKVENENYLINVVETCNTIFNNKFPLYVEYTANTKGGWDWIINNRDLK